MDTQKVRVAEAVKALTDLVNSYSNHSPEFNAAMEREHRTLQNSFSRLCLGWIEHIASPEYRTDPRNQSSKDVAQKVLGAFRERMSAEGYTDSTLDLMSKPSGYCSMV